VTVILGYFVLGTVVQGYFVLGTVVLGYFVLGTVVLGYFVLGTVGVPIQIMLLFSGSPAWYPRAEGCGFCRIPTELHAGWYRPQFCGWVWGKSASEGSPRGSLVRQHAGHMWLVQPQHTQSQSTGSVNQFCFSRSRKIMDVANFKDSIYIEIEDRSELRFLVKSENL
jgi:hypothetical protein